MLDLWKLKLIKERHLLCGRGPFFPPPFLAFILPKQTFGIMLHFCRVFEKRSAHINCHFWVLTTSSQIQLNRRLGYARKNLYTGYWLVVVWMFGADVPAKWWLGGGGARYGRWQRLGEREKSEGGGGSHPRGEMA